MSTSPRPPSRTGSAPRRTLGRRLKDFCYALAFPSVARADRPRSILALEPTLQRATEIGTALPEPVCLFVGLGQEAMTTANILAMRFGSALSEATIFKEDRWWGKSGTSSSAAALTSVLYILPHPLLTIDLDAMIRRHGPSAARIYQTSMAPDAPIRPFDHDQVFVEVG